MATFRSNSRITTTANDLHAAFHLARSEAARAKDNITICASDNSMDDDADCGGTWEDGFIVFIDTTGDLLRNTVDETVLRRHPAIADGVTLAVENGATFFSYGPSGLGRGNVLGNTAVTRMMVCDKRGTDETSANTSAARLFVATPLGRATIVRDKSAVDAALAGMGGVTCP
jgi:type IV fimbrial biogenesis protein FimT